MWAFLLCILYREGRKSLPDARMRKVAIRFWRYRVYKINLHCMGYDDYAPRNGSKTWKGYTWMVVPFAVAVIYALLVVVALHQYAI